MTRITQQQMLTSLQTNMGSSLGRLQRTQEKVSSGKEISRPSDDPSGVASALQFRGSIQRADQLARNADDGLSWLSVADGALTGMQSVLSRARELALRGGSAALNASDREALAKEVDGLRENALSIANTSRLGRPIFSGNAVPTPPAADVAYSSTFAYQGDAGTVTRMVAEGVSVQVNVTGPEVFGPPGADVFSALTQLAVNLRTNPSALPASLTAIDAASTRVLTGLAQVGSRVNQIESARDRTDSIKAGQEDALAEIESVDLAKALTDLKLQETAYQAALGVSARSLQLSLLDFLR
jgi:flagellar hook-associated protein 3 FlgL